MSAASDLELLSESSSVDTHRHHARHGSRLIIGGSIAALSLVLVGAAIFKSPRYQTRTTGNGKFASMLYQFKHECGTTGCLPDTTTARGSTVTMQVTYCGINCFTTKTTTTTTPSPPTPPPTPPVVTCDSCPNGCIISGACHYSDPAVCQEAQGRWCQKTTVTCDSCQGGCIVGGACHNSDPSGNPATAAVCLQGKGQGNQWCEPVTPPPPPAPSPPTCDGFVCSPGWTPISDQAAIVGKGRSNEVCCRVEPCANYEYVENHQCKTCPQGTISKHSYKGQHKGLPGKNASGKTSTSNQEAGLCEDWCADKITWSEKCAMAGCAGCSACGQASTPAPPAIQMKWRGGEPGDQHCVLGDSYSGYKCPAGSHEITDEFTCHSCLLEFGFYFHPPIVAGSPQNPNGCYVAENPPHDGWFNYKGEREPYEFRRLMCVKDTVQLCADSTTKHAGDDPTGSDTICVPTC